MADATSLAKQLRSFLSLYAQKGTPPQDLKKLERSYQVSLETDWKFIFPSTDVIAEEKGSVEERSAVRDHLAEAMAALSILHGVKVRSLLRTHPPSLMLGQIDAPGVDKSHMTDTCKRFCRLILGHIRIHLDRRIDTEDEENEELKNVGVHAEEEERGEEMGEEVEESAFDDALKAGTAIDWSRSADAGCFLQSYGETATPAALFNLLSTANYWKATVLPLDESEKWLRSLKVIEGTSEEDLNSFYSSIFSNGSYIRMLGDGRCQSNIDLAHSVLFNGHVGYFEADHSRDATVVLLKTLTFTSHTATGAPAPDSDEGEKDDIPMHVSGDDQTEAQIDAELSALQEEQAAMHSETKLRVERIMTLWKNLYDLIQTQGFVEFVLAPNFMKNLLRQCQSTAKQFPSHFAKAAAGKAPTLVGRVAALIFLSDIMHRDVAPTFRKFGKKQVVYICPKIMERAFHLYGYFIRNNQCFLDPSQYSFQHTSADPTNVEYAAREFETISLTTLHPEYESHVLHKLFNGKTKSGVFKYVIHGRRNLIPKRFKDTDPHRDRSKTKETTDKKKDEPVIPKDTWKAVAQSVCERFPFIGRADDDEIEAYKPQTAEDASVRNTALQLLGIDVSKLKSDSIINTAVAIYGGEYKLNDSDEDLQVLAEEEESIASTDKKPNVTQLFSQAFTEIQSTENMPNVIPAVTKEIMEEVRTDKDKVDLQKLLSQSLPSSQSLDDILRVIAAANANAESSSSSSAGNPDGSRDRSRSERRGTSGFSSSSSSSRSSVNGNPPSLVNERRVFG